MDGESLFGAVVDAGAVQNVEIPESSNMAILKSTILHLPLSFHSYLPPGGQLHTRPQASQSRFPTSLLFPFPLLHSNGSSLPLTSRINKPFDLPPHQTNTTSRSRCSCNISLLSPLGRFSLFLSWSAENVLTVGRLSSGRHKLVLARRSVGIRSRYREL